MIMAKPLSSERVTLEKASVSAPVLARGAGVMSWLRSARRSMGLACLLAISTQTGCITTKKGGLPDEDENAPWALREPQEVVLRDQMCFPSTVSAEIDDGIGDLPSRWALSRGVDQEKLTRALYDRVRHTGEYDIRIKQDGGSMISAVPASGAYRQVLAMHPLVKKEAEALHSAGSDLDLTGAVIEEWSGAEAERTRLNREIDQFRLLKLCLGFEIEDPALASISREQQPFPPSWVDQFLLDPMDPGLFSGSELIDGESLLIPPYVPPEGQKLRYVSFDRVKGDHLSVFLGQVIDPKYYDQIARLAVFVRLTSPEGEWRVPVEYLNTSEQFGIYVRSLTFEAADPFELKKKYWGKKGSLRQMLVAKQYEYHVENKYPPFTEANRDANIAQLNGHDGKGPLKKIAPTDSDSYVLRYLYEGDPEHTEQISYTYQETLTLIEELGTIVEAALHRAGLPAHIKVKIIVTALGRTVEYQEALSAGVTLVDYMDPGPDNPFRKGNRNAVHSKQDANGNFIELTSHGYFNAADVSSARIVLIDTQTNETYTVGIQENEALISIARVAMYQFLADKGAAGLALGSPEGDHLHMVGVRAPEQPTESPAFPASPKKGAKKGGRS